MRIIMLGLLMLGCGSSPTPLTTDAGLTTSDAPIEDARVDLPDVWREDAPADRDAAAADAGVDAAPSPDAYVELDSGTDAPVLPDAGTTPDAGPAPPSAPSDVVEIGQNRCFRDVDNHAWCVRPTGAITYGVFYVGDATHVQGECALDGDRVLCLGASGMLEPMGVTGAIVAQNSSSSAGCVIPSSGSEVRCWFSDYGNWTLTEPAPAGVIEAAAMVANRVIVMIDGIYMRQGVVTVGGGGTAMLGGIGTFGSVGRVVEWRSQGGRVAWLNPDTGRIVWRTTYNAADNATPLMTGVSPTDAVAFTPYFAMRPTVPVYAADGQEVCIYYVDTRGPTIACEDRVRGGTIFARW